MSRPNEEWCITCVGCGKLKFYSKHASYYEAKRLGNNLCKTCSMERAWDKRGRKSQYDEFIHKGDEFGFLKVISDKVGKNNVVTCRCKCGNEIGCRASYLLDGRSVACRGCRVGSLSSNWRGIGKVPSMFLIKLRNQAEERNIPFRLTLEELSDLFEKQGGKCALTGWPLVFESLSAGTKTKRTASLDRVDYSKPYEIGNVQWVYSHINSMKNSHSIERFVELCRAVVEYYDKNRNQ